MTELKYYVYFPQINQTRFTVVARTEASAVKKALREWNRGYGQMTEDEATVETAPTTPGEEGE
jgi:hypothetical protein